VPEFQLLDGVKEGVMGSHDAGAELGADALGQPGGTQTRDELPAVLLPPALVKLLTAESRALQIQREGK